jgi:activator of HSP90 ATPase
MPAGRLALHGENEKTMTMTPAIQQRVTFRTSPKMLFEMYLDSKKHSAATGAPAKLSRKVGGNWTAHHDQIGGKNLLLIPGRMIVQAWRAAHWKKDDLSVLVLKFSKVPSGARVDLVHASVPMYDHKGVREGWVKYYWKPWKKYLSKKI